MNWIDVREHETPKGKDEYRHNALECIFGDAMEQDKSDDSLDKRKPSIAAERMPPWLPTKPPKTADTKPPIHFHMPFSSTRSAMPVIPERPAKTSNAPKTYVRAGALA